MRNAPLVILLLLHGTPAVAEEPPRALGILRTGVKHWTRQGELKGMTVAATVAVEGCDGREISVKIGLAGSDGVPLRAANGTPEAYRDERGRVRAMAMRRVEGDAVAFELFVPYRAIVPPEERDRRTVVAVSARCDDLRALTQFGDSLPPLRPPAVPPGMWIRRLIPGREREDCLTVALEIERGALERGTLEAGVRLRTRGGKAIRAVEGAPRLFVGAEGAFECRRSWDPRARRQAAEPYRLLIPYEFLDLEPSGRHVLVLSCFARLGGWRAVREREVVVGAVDVARPTVLALEVLRPDAETLGKPYQGRSGSYGLDSNLLRLEATARGLEEGLHVLRIDLGASGRRFLRARVAPDSEEARFAGDVPVPCGVFEARLELEGPPGEGAPTLKGEMAPHAWAPSARELANWREALARWRSKHQGPDSAAFVASTLARMAEGYLMLGDCEQAAQAGRECIAIAGSDQVFRVLAATYLLQGRPAELNTLYEQRLAAKAEHGLYFEWAHRRALLEPDLEPARALWRRGTELACKEGVEPPPPPIWIESS